MATNDCYVTRLFKIYVGRYAQNWTQSRHDNKWNRFEKYYADLLSQSIVVCLFVVHMLAFVMHRKQKRNVIKLAFSAFFSSWNDSKDFDARFKMISFTLARESTHGDRDSWQHEKY